MSLRIFCYKKLLEGIRFSKVILHQSLRQIRFIVIFSAIDSYVQEIEQVSISIIFVYFFLYILLILLFFSITARLLILIKLLALKPTIYKFLIGGRKVNLSYRNCDWQYSRNHIILPHAWMAFIEKRIKIQQLVQSSMLSKVMILDLVKIHVELVIKYVMLTM